MRRVLGIPLSQYIWAGMVLSLYLAALVKRGMDVDSAVEVGVGTWVLATAALVLRHWAKPAKISPFTNTNFPWGMLVRANVINLGGLMMLWGKGMTLLTFLAPLVGVAGANLIFFAEWRFAQGRASDPESQSTQN
jgi:hypothetical protein